MANSNKKKCLLIIFALEDVLLHFERKGDAEKDMILMRPHAESLLKALLGLGSSTVNIGLISTAERNELEYMASELIGSGWSDKLLQVFGTEFNMLDMDTNGDDYVRDLGAVWDNSNVKNFNFDAKNTIIVDNQAQKVRAYSRNAVLVDPLVDDVDSDKSLANLLSYLLVLVDAWDGEDIQNYLSMNPYEAASRAEAPQPSSSSGAKGSTEITNNIEKYKLFISGIPDTVSESTLKEKFAEYGELIDCMIGKDRHNGRSRGFGFVSFSNEQAMNKALNGNVQELFGERDSKWITVTLAKPRGTRGVPTGDQQCYVCNRKGHFARECPSRDQAPPPSLPRSRESRDHRSSTMEYRPSNRASYHSDRHDRDRKDDRDRYERDHRRSDSRVDRIRDERRSERSRSTRSGPYTRSRSPRNDRHRRR